MKTERVDLIVVGGTIFTASELGIIKNGALAIKGNKIVDVGKKSEIEKKYKAENKIDASNKIIMPGLIDGHVHNVQIMLRSSFSDELANLPPIWLNFLIPYERSLSYSQVKKASLLSILNMIKSGTTCFVEAGGPEPEAIAEASLESGIRAMITKSTIDRDPNLPMYEETDSILKNYEMLIKKWHGINDGRLKVWISLREVMLDSIELYEKLFELAKNYNTRVTMHLAEDRSEVDFCLKEYGMRPVELMYDKGFLNNRVLASHMVFLNDKEARILERAGTSVCWCPYVDAYVMGPSRVNDLLARGVKVIFGSDGGAWGNLDLFEQARHGRVSSKIVSNSLYHDKTGLTTNDVIKMLTSYGGYALGENVGILKKGYKADVVILEQDLNLVPNYSVEEVLVNMASSRNVDTVLIDGRLVMKNKHIITVNEEKVVHDCKKMAYDIEEMIMDLRNSILK